jgi:cytidyltransferase-like protein
MSQLSIVCTSGYYDPIHPGHVECWQLAAEIGKLIVIVNNDIQAIRKNGKVFQPLADRLILVKDHKSVNKVIASIDTDELVCETLRLVHPDYFVKGGDWNIDNFPEPMRKVCEEINCKIIFGLGEKIRHSSEIRKR